MRFFVLAVPHSVTSQAFNACAFTAKVLKLCRMLMMHGHHVVHLGCEGSEVECSEHVSVTTQADLTAAYGAHDWQKDFFKYDLNDSCYQTFYRNAIAAIAARKQPRDFLLCPWGAGHKPVADAHPDLIVVESGCGYSGGFFARFKVFESYALMHAYGGLNAVQHPGVPDWYDVVIPNSFDTSQFSFCPAKDDYFLCLGRITPGKGVHVAAQAVGEIGGRLIVAGQGDYSREFGEVPPHVELAGYADVETRRWLLSRARAVFVLSTYTEPFGGVMIEAALSGTPVITTDWGSATENVLHGVTGYRCRTFSDITWAARNIGRINPQACHDWAAANFSLERVAAQYDHYFRSVADIYGGAGWYEPHPERAELDWLTRFYPPASVTGG